MPLSPTPPFIKHFRPLSPMMMHVLGALAAGECHLYLLEIRIRRDALGTLLPAKSTIRSALLATVEQGLVEMVAIKIGGKAGKERHLYSLTEEGWKRLAAEYDRLEQLTSIYRRRLSQRAMLNNLSIL